MGQDVRHLPTLKNPSSRPNPLSTLLYTPDARFNMIHTGILGSPPPSQGFTYILTCVDRLIWWPEAIPIADITEETVARAFVDILERTIWRPFDTSNWQRTPVWFKLVEQTYAFTRFEAYPYQSIPSKLQRPGGTLQPPTQGFTQSSRWPITFSGGSRKFKRGVNGVKLLGVALPHPLILRTLIFWLIINVRQITITRVM